MVPSEEFMRHAAECKRMAEFSRDPESRAVWRRMAERWVRCAELARHQDPPLQRGARKGKAQRISAQAGSHESASY